MLVESSQEYRSQPPSGYSTTQTDCSLLYQFQRDLEAELDGVTSYGSPEGLTGVTSYGSPEKEVAVDTYVSQATQVDTE